MKKELEQKELPIQFSYIDKAKKLMLNWTKENKIILKNIEYIVPFILSDKNLSVWLFFDNKITKNNYKKMGQMNWLKLNI